MNFIIYSNIKIALKPKFKNLIFPKNSGLIKFPSNAKIMNLILQKIKLYIQNNHCLQKHKKHI